MPGALVAVGRPAARIVIEDWSAFAVGTRGLPAGWQRQSWGESTYNLTIVEDEHRPALHMKSQNENSTITKDLKGEVYLRETPVFIGSDSQGLFGHQCPQVRRGRLPAPVRPH